MSRQATQLAMGPWYMRDEQKPFMPGFNAAVLKHQAMSGRIKPETLLRGPTTNQFWMPAIKVPGVSRLLGQCHACAAAVAPHAKQCPKCDADLALPEDVDQLGLLYVTDDERAAAQRELAEARANAPAPTAKQTPAPVKPVAPASPAAPSAATPSHATPEVADVELTEIEPAGGDEDAAYVDAGGHDIEDLWDAAPTSPRRAKRSGPDPMLLGAGAVLLLVLFVVGFFALQSASKKDQQRLGDLSSDNGDGADGETDAPAEPTPPTPPRVRPAPSDEQMTQVQDRLLPVVDRLRQSTVPAALSADYDALVAQVEEARVAHEAGDLGLAYQRYREADRAAGLLDIAMAEHEANMDDRAEAEQARARAYDARKQAEADDAQRWAPQDWALAEEGLATGEAALTSDEPGAMLDAYDAFRRSVSDFEFARSQASLGFLAVQAGEALEQAVAKSFTPGELSEYGGDPYTELRRLQEQGRAYLADSDYYNALDAFEIGMLRLDQAERGVKREYGKNYYAFAAGYAATDALIAIAAGDGLSAAKRELLGEAFDDLSLQAKLMEALPDGDEPDYGECAAVLVGRAREAVASELGAEAQLSYSIGFQFRIVQQTLENPRLTAEHNTRIGRTLRLIEEQAGQAGYSRELVALIDTFKTALRNTDSPEALERARSSWRDILITMRTYDRAMPIVNPEISTPADPELFPGAGG